VISSKGASHGHRKLDSGFWVAGLLMMAAAIVKHAAALAKLFKVREYEDGSGYDFARYRTEQ
jgi:hypothetical protein